MNDWREHMRALSEARDPLQFGRFAPPDDFGGHESAVLLAFAEGDDGLELLLIERAHDQYAHSGQPAFPGGRADAGDVDAVATALREAREETGLDPDCVEVLAVLPRVHIPVSGHAVTPVIAHWHTPCDIGVMDATEVAQVVRVPVRALIEPANRVTYRHPSGSQGPAFHVAGLTVWGFTGGVIAGLLSALAWDEPWDHTRLFDPDAT